MPIKQFEPLPRGQSQDISAQGAAAPQPQQQAPQFEYGLAVQDMKRELHNRWRIEANALQNSWFPDREKFNTALAKLNSKYQMEEYKTRQALDAKLAEQKRFQQLMQTDVHAQTREQQAQLRLELPAEQERLVFDQPKPPKAPDTLSAAQITSPAMKKMITGFAEAAPDMPWIERGNRKTPKGLLNAYTGWKSLVKYDFMSPEEQHQYDQLWDVYMGQDERFAKSWEGNKPTLRIMQSRGRGAQAMKQRALGTTSPLGRAIGGKVSRRTQPEPAPQPVPQRQAPIQQRNRRTGQTRISYDGGRTWQTSG